MGVLKRLLAVLVMIPMGICLVPTLVLFGQKGVDKLMDVLDPVMEWAGFD